MRLTGVVQARKGQDRVAATVILGAAAAVAAGLAVVGGLSSIAASAAQTVTVRVTPSSSVEDQSINIEVSGLKPHAQVTVALRSTDASDVTWTSRAAFLADSRGVVDTATSPARGGSYLGAWQMGLIASMTTSGHRPDALYVWPGSTGRASFSVAVTSGGREIASTRFSRSWGRVPLTEKDETVASSRFAGSFYAPRDAKSRTALLLFEGSEGGIPATTRLLARRFAAEGYPALVIAYFGAPGLPQALEKIPLEYFQHALEWLDRQPQVNPRRVAVLGISRGSEAALLLGVHYPSLVHGVIALDPSNHSGCGIPNSKRPVCSGPAWMFQGKPVPYSRQFDDAEPTDNPAAIIPVERLKAPLLLACGDADTVWISCTYADAILSRLTQHHSRIGRVLYSYPNAGHGVGALLPDEPGRAQLDWVIPAGEKARERLWPLALAFLREIH